MVHGVLKAGWLSAVAVGQGSLYVRNVTYDVGPQANTSPTGMSQPTVTQPFSHVPILQHPLPQKAHAQAERNTCTVALAHERRHDNSFKQHGCLCRQRPAECCHTKALSHMTALTPAPFLHRSQSRTAARASLSDLVQSMQLLHDLRGREKGHRGNGDGEQV